MNHSTGAYAPRHARQHWQHAAELILAQTDVADVSRQLEVALFQDGKLDLAALYA
jgi:hypothetical protein